MGQTQGGEEKEVGLQDIQELYRKFASECPSGNLHLHEFKRIFGINSSSTVEETAYMEIVFESFDTNKVRKQKKTQWHFGMIPWCEWYSASTIPSRMVK